jgi:uncharacterized protein YcbK (DUF882 family)
LAAAVGLGLGGASTAANALTMDELLARTLNYDEARKLSFNHLHTGERLNITYYEQGQYDPAALNQVRHLLRDFRTGDTHEIDPKLLDLLHATSRKTECILPFQVISGYRSPATNAMLHDHSGEVAKASLHMEGMAIDIHQPGVDLIHTYSAARSLGAGGVGYYPRSQFVHVDVGRVRHWEGT